jgi:hypothetical protein
MIARIFASAVAALLLAVFVAPVALKLIDDYALLAVVVIGLVLMLADLVQSLRS